MHICECWLIQRTDSKTQRAPYTHDNQSTKVVNKIKTIARIESIGTAVPG